MIWGLIWKGAGGRGGVPGTLESEEYEQVSEFLFIHASPPAGVWRICFSDLGDHFDDHGGHNSVLRSLDVHLGPFEDTISLTFVVFGWLGAHFVDSLFKFVPYFFEAH